MANENFSLRYAVLHHTGISKPHFDLLFEWRPDSLLIANRFSEWPPKPATTMERLPDHRRPYLDYEGPITGDRGHVRRVASGLCSVEVIREDSIMLTLDTGLQICIPRARQD